MNSHSKLVADPSNADMAGAWDGDEGTFWVTRARHFDEVFAHLHGPFLAAAAIGEREHVLDVGCGNGQSTRDAARVAAQGRALGVDLSSQMLAYARSAAAAEGVTNVEFEQADA